MVRPAVLLCLQLLQERGGSPTIASFTGKSHLWQAGSFPVVCMDGSTGAPLHLVFSCPVLEACCTEVLSPSWPPPAAQGFSQPCSNSGSFHGSAPPSHGLAGCFVTHCWDIPYMPGMCMGPCGRSQCCPHMPAALCIFALVL